MIKNKAIVVKIILIIIINNYKNNRWINSIKKTCHKYHLINNNHKLINSNNNLNYKVKYLKIRLHNNKSNWKFQLYKKLI